MLVLSSSILRPKNPFRTVRILQLLLLAFSSQRSKPKRLAKLDTECTCLHMNQAHANSKAVTLRANCTKMPCPVCICRVCRPYRSAANYLSCRVWSWASWPRCGQWGRLWPPLSRCMATSVPSAPAIQTRAPYSEVSTPHTARCCSHSLGEPFFVKCGGHCRGCSVSHLCGLRTTLRTSACVKVMQTCQCFCVNCDL